MNILLLSHLTYSVIIIKRDVFVIRLLRILMRCRRGRGFSILTHKYSAAESRNSGLQPGLVIHEVATFWVLGVVDVGDVSAVHPINRSVHVLVTFHFAGRVIANLVQRQKPLAEKADSKGKRYKT